MAKFDVHQHVTNQIIAAIEAGAPPWRRPWTGEAGGACFPLHSTGEPYRGINVLMLWLRADEKGYSAAHWFTYRQASALGGQVRKGEKSVTVVKYGAIERETETGDPNRIGYAKAYAVFNADQIDNLPAKFHRQPDPARDLGAEADPALEAFYAATGLEIVSSDKPRAFYNVNEDRIHMPPVSTFRNASGYYATLAHEACHATGHKTRLDRFETFRDTRDTAFEELIAEICSATTNLSGEAMRRTSWLSLNTRAFLLTRWRSAGGFGKNARRAGRLCGARWTVFGQLSVRSRPAVACVLRAGGRRPPEPRSFLLRELSALKLDPES